jgi:hypothetical protein
VQRPDQLRDAVSTALLRYSPVAAGWLLILVIHLTRDGSTGTLNRALGALLALPALVAGYVYLVRRHFDRLPVAEFALLQVYIYWGMPTAAGSLHRGVPVTETGVRMALLACLIFVAVGILVAPLGRRAGAGVAVFLARYLPARVPSTVRIFLPIWIAVAVMAAVGLIRLAPMALRYPLVVTTSSAGLLSYLVIQRARRGGRGWLPEVVAGFLSVAGLMSGMMATVLSPLVMLLALRMLVEKRVPWRVMLVGLGMFVILNPAKKTFRETFWQQWDSSRWDETASSTIVTPGDALEVWWKGIHESWVSDGDDSAQETSIDRLNYLTCVASTMEKAGRVVPWDYGRKWPLVLQTLVPRAVYPEKKKLTHEFNNRFNVLFGFQTIESTKRTTFSFPIISDGYWNFGWLGVVLVGAIIGFYWGFLSNLWHPNHWGLAWLGIFILSNYQVATYLVDQMSGFPQIMFGIGLASWLITIVASLLVLPGKRRTSRRWAQR